MDAGKKIMSLVEGRGQSDLGEIVDIVIPKYCQLLHSSQPLFIAEMPRQKLRKMLLGNGYTDSN